MLTSADLKVIRLMLLSWFSSSHFPEVTPYQEQHQGNIREKIGNYIVNLTKFT